MSEKVLHEAELCQALRASVATARRAIADGTFVDLAGFDRELASLCAAIVRLPAALRPAAEIELMALLADLDELSQALIAQEAGRAAGETDAARLRAVHAYGPQGVPDRRSE
jgi:hypothetical protein